MRTKSLLAATGRAACASMADAAWAGEGTEPFDGARDACETASAALPKDDRAAAFGACMAKRGWHRRP
jgi:hypothetical protein